MLVKAWAEFRTEKSDNKLTAYLRARSLFSSNFTARDFSALNKVLTNINNICHEYDRKDGNIKLFIKDVDWLMNQLIIADQESNDPFIEKVLKPGSLDQSDKSQQDEGGQETCYECSPQIAIIDGNPSDGKHLVSTLQNFNLKVVLFTSVRAFSEARKSKSFDLVLHEILFADTSIEEVFRFAENLVKDGIKVISCSSEFSFETRLLAVRACVSDYVVKPINTYILIEKIGRALSLQQIRNHTIVSIDDQKSMGEFYKVALEQIGCSVTFFSSAEALFQGIEVINPDMFLIDMMMPDVDGFEVAKMIRQEHKFDFTPIVFLTADESIENRLAAIDAGADDVISKAAAVPYVTHQVNTRLNRASKVRSFVAKDPLTGVLNHGQIVDAANQSIRLSKRRKQHAAIAVIDVDRFKRINDRYGHVIGDRVLTALGQTLSTSVRETDYVGRYGGEEFVIVFQDCSVDDATEKVSSIKDTFAQMPFEVDEDLFTVTFSAGLTGLIEFDNVQPAIAAADKALYKAKNGGRNKVIAITREKTALPRDQ